MIKKKWKRLVAAILCGGIMLGMQPTNAQAAEEVKPEFEISVTATVDRNESREVLRMVNEARAEAGVKPYVMSKEMEEAAITRAFELIANYSHGRPKGEAYYSIFPEYGIKLNYNLHLWSSENIAEGWIPDAESVMQMWKDSANHWYNITNQWSTHIGIACVQYQGSTYWVQIFARDPQNVTEAPKEGTDKNIETREYVVNANYISSKKPLIFTEETVELKPGESTEFDLELAKRNIFGGTSGFGKVIFTSLNPEHIIIPQEAPITVDQEGIHVSQDAKAGTYPLTIQVGNKKAVKNIIVSLCKHPQNSLTTEEKAPTCTEEGYRKTTCQECGQIISNETLSMLPHQKNEEWEIQQNATCAAAGKKVRKCIMCRTVMEEESIPQTENHSWDKGNITKAATCTEDGEQTFICQVCNKIRTEKINKLGHNWGEWQIVTEPSWNIEGQEKRVCTRCELEETRSIPALSEDHAHDFTGKETVIKEPTCTEDGSKTIACTNPNCDAVKEETLPAIGHKAGEWEITEEATCTKEGKRVQKCAACQEILDTEIIPALGHTWSEWTVEKEAAWDTEGQEKRVCANCALEETRSIPSLSENHEHDFTGKETITKEATCTEDGSKTIACVNPNCDAVKEETLLAIGHKAGEWEITEEATCTKEGKRVQKCAACQEILDTEIIPALGHSWSEWVVEKEADTTTEGLKKRTCERCNEIEEEIIAKLPEENKNPSSTVTPPSQEIPNSSDEKPQSGEQNKAVETGDDQVNLLWMLLGLGALAVGAATVIWRKKINKI